MFIPYTVTYLARTSHSNAALKVASAASAFGSVTIGLQYGCITAADTAKHRYGMNGQEKDDEVAGEGNSYTAEFWQYDGRLGRRFNTDPVKKAWINEYACFWDNPVYYKDPNIL